MTPEPGKTRPLIRTYGMTAREVTDHADSLTHYLGTLVTPLHVLAAIEREHR